MLENDRSPQPTSTWLTALAREQDFTESATSRSTPTPIARGSGSAARQRTGGLHRGGDLQPRLRLHRPVRGEAASMPRDDCRSGSLFKNLSGVSASLAWRKVQMVGFYEQAGFQKDCITTRRHACRSDQSQHPNTLVIQAATSPLCHYVRSSRGDSEFRRTPRNQPTAPLS